MMKKVSIVVASVLWILVVSSSIAFGFSWTQFKGAKVTAIGNVNPRNEALQKLIPEFEKLTGIKVEVTLISEKELRDKLVPDLAARTGLYDMVWFNEHEIPLYTQNDWILPLNDFINDPKLTDPKVLDWNDLFGMPIRAITYKGKIWALPAVCEVGVLTYRKDLFDQYGVYPPASWRETIETAKKLTIDTNGDGKPDIHGITLRAQPGLGTYLLHIWTCVFKSYGGDYFDKNGKPLVNSPAAVESVDVYKEMGKYCPPGYTSHTWYEVTNLFSQGYAGMTVDSSNFPSFFGNPKLSKVAGKVEVAPCPMGPYGQYPQTWVGMFGIAAASKNPKAVWLLDLWATSSEVVKKMYEMGNCQGGPPRRSNFELLPQYGYTERAMKLIPRALDSATPDDKPMISEWPHVARILATSISEVLAGMKPTQRALNEAYEKIYKVMEEAGYYR